MCYIVLREQFVRGLRLFLRGVVYLLIPTESAVSYSNIMILFISFQQHRNQYICCPRVDIVIS